MTVIFGIDANKSVLPLLVDASGRPIISASQLTTTGGKLLVDSNGRLVVTQDEDYLSEFVPTLARYENIALAAGTNVLDAYTVAANQVYRVNVLTVAYFGTVAGVTVRAAVYNGTDNFNLNTFSPVVSGVFYSFYPNMHVSAGWIIRLVITGATLNDDGHLILHMDRIR